jgi:hypothetical protein
VRRAEQRRDALRSAWVRGRTAVTRTGRDPLRLSPLFAAPFVAFPALWLLCAGLSQVHVLAVQRPWSSTAWIVVLTVPVAFAAGGLGVHTLIRARAARNLPTRPASIRVRRRLLVVLLVIGYAELAREFASAGAAPLLSSHIDQTRIGASTGVLALLTDSLTICAIIALVTPRRLTLRDAGPEFAFAGLAMFGFLLAGGRDTIALPLIAVVICRTLYWRPPTLRALAWASALGACAFSLVFYLRTGQDSGTAFSRELYGHVVPSTSSLLVPLLPIHFALAINDSVLARLVDYFPHALPFGHGLYDSWALHAVIPALNLDVVTAALTPPWLVSTLAGPFWADGGVPVVVAGCIATGALLTAPYALYLRTRRLRWALIAGYLGALGLYGAYMNYLTFFKDWLVVVPALFLLGRWIELRAVAIAGPSDAEPALSTADNESPRLGARAAWVRRQLGPGTRGRLLALGGSVIALLAAVTGLADRNVTRERVVAAVPQLFGSSPEAIPPPTLAPEQRLRVAGLPAGALAGALTTEQGTAAASTIWSFHERSRRLLADQMAIVGDRLVVQRHVQLGPAPAVAANAYAVGSWDPRGIEMAFELTTIGSEAEVTGIGLGGSHERTVLGTTPPIPTVPGATRKLTLVSVAGSRPDLIVLDRGLPGARMRVRVYSGASAFRVMLADTVIPASGLRTRDWSVAFGPVDTNTPDLLLATRTPVTRTGHMEVHVFLGTSAYSRVLEQTPIAPLASASVYLRLLVIREHGVPALLAVNPRTHTAAVLSLAASGGYGTS